MAKCGQPACASIHCCHFHLPLTTWLPQNLPAFQAPDVRIFEALGLGCLMKWPLVIIHSHVFYHWNHGSSHPIIFSNHFKSFRHDSKIWSNMFNPASDSPNQGTLGTFKYPGHISGAPSLNPTGSPRTPHAAQCSARPTCSAAVRVSWFSLGVTMVTAYKVG
jgi:hypothetical protein